MKMFLPVLLLLLFITPIFAQQFSQYNTGTLFDSFENPSQRAFIPDSSRSFAFNFLLPNFNANLLLNGDAQASLKSRYFFNVYNNGLLKVNQGQINNIAGDANAYLLMIKMFGSLNGDTEFGFSWQMRMEGRGQFSDESVAVFNGTKSFNMGDGTYNNIFNDNYHYQSYHQLSFTYREKINRQLSFGIKLSGLLGIQYQELNIINSSAAFEINQDQANVGLVGAYYSGGAKSFLTSANYAPNFNNPGASVSLGTTYKTEDNLVLQANVKDLGFIHWNNNSESFFFNGTTLIKGLSTADREDSIYNKVSQLIKTNGIRGSFTTPTNGRAELSVTKCYWLDYDKLFNYSPTLVLSKELFYQGYVAALVNHLKYKNDVLTLTATYDNFNEFNLGAQFMIKSPDWEFYIGSDKLFQTATLVSDQFSKSYGQVAKNNAFTGGDFFMGFSLKFGPVIEHPMNASTIPMGEKGFFGRLFDKVFKGSDQL